MFPFPVRPVREYQLTLYADPPDPHDPASYDLGFGLRVVGAAYGERGLNCARVLWVLPNGPAERAGVRVGDRVRGQQLRIDDVMK